MASSIRRILQGQKASYKLLEVLKEPSIHQGPVYKGAVLSGSNAVNVAIKDLVQERELRIHQQPSITGCKYIRQMVDIIDKGQQDDWTPSKSSVKPRLVFEWMDTDLWHARPFRRAFQNPNLPAIVTKSILEALLVFQQNSGVHTDVNPNNIFLSNIDAKIPLVKLGDLDNAFSEGVAINYIEAQTPETRAPEVWRGQGVWHCSDMWSLGVTITHWLLSYTLFGPWDKIIDDHRMAWCLAKIFRLVGHIDPPDNPVLKEEFELAKDLEAGQYSDPETNEIKRFITLGTLRQELLKLPREICSEACIDFIEYLLVIDPNERPTAEMALEHPFVNSTKIS